MRACNSIDFSLRVRRPALPDIDGNPDDYEVLTFETQPGDIIIHHANTVHGSRGKTDPHGANRAAASIRYIGDDVRFLRKASEPREAISQWEIQRDPSVATDRSKVDPMEHLQAIALSLLNDGERPEDNPVAAWRWPQVFLAKVHGSKM